MYVSRSLKKVCRPPSRRWILFDFHRKRCYFENIELVAFSVTDLSYNKSPKNGVKAKGSDNGLGNDRHRARYIILYVSKSQMIFQVPTAPDANSPIQADRRDAFARGFVEC